MTAQSLANRLLPCCAAGLQLFDDLDPQFPAAREASQNKWALIGMLLILLGGLEPQGAHMRGREF